MRAIVFVALLGATAAASPPPSADAFARRGVALYNLGKYDEAIVAFEEAYTLFQSDALLFNLAQAHRQLGHCELALQYYKRFMAGTPAPALATQVETLLPKLEAACHTKFERPAGATTPEPVATAAVEPPPAPSLEVEVPEPPAVEPPIRARVTAAVTAGTVISNKTAPAAGVKASVTTPLPWVRAAELGASVGAAKLWRAEGDRDATLTYLTGVMRLVSEQPWARLTIGAEAGAMHISSLDTSSGVVPGVRRAGLWAPFARAEAGVERTIANAFALRIAVAAGIAPRSGPMLASMSQVDLVVGVRFER